MTPVYMPYPNQSFNSSRNYAAGIRNPPKKTGIKFDQKIVKANAARVKNGRKNRKKSCRPADIAKMKSLLHACRKPNVMQWPRKIGKVLPFLTALVSRTRTEKRYMMHVIKV